MAIVFPSHPPFGGRGIAAQAFHLGQPVLRVPSVTPPPVAGEIAIGVARALVVIVV